MNKLQILIALTAIILTGACTKDLVVKNIKDANVTVLAPTNNTKTAVNAITFWWVDLDGAEQYNIQIVKPNFAAAQILVLDTNVTGNKYTRSLTPGIYQWRIRGMNGGGNTAYSTFNLAIDTTSDLSSQVVVVTAPTNGYLTANKTVAFSWTGILSALSYEVQVLDGLNNILKDTITTKVNYTYSIPTTTGGNFSWKVKAFNNSSISQFNTPQTFTIDLMPPAPPTLASPLNYSFVTTNTVDLKWTRNGSTVTDVRYDSIYVSIDSTFPGYLISAAERVNGTVINTAAFTPSLGPSVTQSEYYFWRVRSIDSVGNKSVFSAFRKFHINP